MPAPPPSAVDSTLVAQNQLERRRGGIDCRTFHPLGLQHNMIVGFAIPSKASGIFNAYRFVEKYGMAG